MKHKIKRDTPSNPSNATLDGGGTKATLQTASGTTDDSSGRRMEQQVDSALTTSISRTSDYLIFLKSTQQHFQKVDRQALVQHHTKEDSKH